MAKGLPRSLANSQLLLPKNAVTKIVVPIRGLVVPITDPGAANGFGTAVFGDLPEGDLIFMGAVLYARLTSTDVDLVAAFAGNLAIGTAPTADATLNGQEVDIVASQAFTTASSSVSAYTRYAAATATLAQVDNRNGALELNFNCFITDATLTGAASMLVEGALHLAYIHLGDDNT